MAHRVSVSLRRLFMEFRYLSAGISKGDSQFSWRYVPAYKEVKEEYHRLKSSTDKVDIEDSMLKCELYHSYLQAVRKEKELEDRYKGFGERSVEDIAASVGFKLPEKYKDEIDS